MVLFENKKKYLRDKSNQSGYVALTATIIIGMVLLVMVAREGFAGFHARFTVLGTEKKEQANALAEGCADQAMASILSDPSYNGATLNSLPSGTCYVDPVDFSVDKKASIHVQSKVGEASAGGTTYSTLSTTIDVGNIHVGSADPLAGMGTLLVQTLVQGNKNYSATPADFKMSVKSNGASMGTFDGSDTGVVLHVTPGTYSVSETPIAGFILEGQPGCNGTIGAGEVKTCSMLNGAVTTSLTLVDAVTNDNSGQKSPTDFTLTIDDVPVDFGVPIDTLPGPHRIGIATSTMDGYLSSVDWSCSPLTLGKNNGASSTVDIATGDNKVCVVKLDDIPPPNPSCADTVMMLDRTGSMSSTERSWLKTAANTLENLYSLVTVNSPALPAPKLGVGSFGGINSAASTTALVPYGNQNGDGTSVKGFLSTVYSDILSAISTMMGSGSCSAAGSSDNCTNISAALSKGSDELGSVNHTLTNQKVLILISDGSPTLPFGSSLTASGTTSPALNVQNGASDAWTNPSNAYSGGDAGASATATTGSGARHQFYNFTFPTIPDDATINGVEVDADAKSVSATGGAATTSPLYPSSNGSFSDFLYTTSTSSASKAVDTNDSDTTYIDTNAVTLTHTFNVPNVSSSIIPTGATVNSVTMYVVARSPNAGDTLTPIVERGTASNSYKTGPAWTLTNTYQTYSYTFPQTGDSKSWTQAEVVNWNNAFGVRIPAASAARVTEEWVVVNYSSATTTSAFSATSSPSSIGTGTWASASSAYLSDNVYATSATNAQQQIWGNFGFAIPSGASIDGIQLATEAKVSGSGSPTSTSILYPTSNGNYSSWSSNNYSVINESGSPSCSSSDYISENSTNSRSSFALDLSGIPTGSIINSITITPSDRGDTSTGGTYATFARINGVNTPNAATTTTTSTSVCTSRSGQTFTLSPVTKTSSTAIEIGVIKVSSGGNTNNTIRIGALNATVSYTPAVSGSLGAELSWNNNSSRSSSETITLSTTESSVMPAGNDSGDRWGSHSWVPSDFNNGNFVVRLTNNSSSGATASVDQITSKVFYTTTSTTTATTSPLYPSSNGSFSDFLYTTSTSSASKAVDTNDSDTTYIDTNAVTLTHTFNVPNVSSSIIPTGATVNSVTMYVVARSPNAGDTLTPIVERGTASNSYKTGPAWTLTNTYQTYSYTFPQTGDSKSWTQAEVVNWNNAFGVRIPAASAARVTEEWVVVGYAMPAPTCQLGVDLSWDGASTTPPWTTEKKITLTSTSTTYAFGKSSDTWGRTWYPFEFGTSTLRARVHAINTGSGCSAADVVNLDWLRLNVFYTSSIARQAALDAADNAKKSGVNIFSIYYNSSPVTVDENFMAELATGSTTYAGHQGGADNDPYSLVLLGQSKTAGATQSVASVWTSPTSAFSKDSKYTTSKILNQMQSYKGFSFSLPPAASVSGIEVDLRNSKTSSGSCTVGAEISSDGGSTFTAAGLTSSSLSSHSTDTAAIGGSTNLWGRTWSAPDFDNGNFIVRLKNNCPTNTTLSVDQLQVKLTYSSVAENSDNDNFFIAPSASDMPGIFDYIGNNVCPAARPVVGAASTASNLLIITRTTNDNSGTASSSDFTSTINTPSQILTNAGVSAPGTTITIAPGAYNVTESAIPGYTEILSDGCYADSDHPIAAGETRVCIISNDDLPPPPPLIITPGTWQETP
ncbi:MAG: hypothetical protein V4438_02290 [Patescibacteria group bacterium]